MKLFVFFALVVADVYDDYGGYGGYDDYDDEYGSAPDPTPAAEELETLEALEDFLAKDPLEPCVLGFFKDETLLDEFQAVADANRYDFRFAYSLEEEVTKGKTAVYVYPPSRFVSKSEKVKNRYPSTKFDGLEKFIYKKSLPLVGQKTWKSGDRYEKVKMPILTLFASVDLEKNPKGFDYFANRLRKVAVEFPSILFNIGDKDDFSYSLGDYDIVLEKKEVGVGIKDGDKFYKMVDKFNVDNLRKFVTAVVNGEIEPKIKETPNFETEDEDEDIDYDDSNVVVLTSENFHLTEDKDSFLEFYAPWCGHCQALKPAFKALADEFENEPNVLVGAMDATAHDPPAEYDVQGYPSLFFKPKGGDIVPYDGDRDLASMAAFIKTNAAGASSSPEL